MGIALKKYRNSEIYGFEYDADAIAIARKTGVYKQIHQIDLDQLQDEDYPEYINKFDSIICGDILEHLRYPGKVIKKLLKYLKKDGFFIASIPNVAHASIKANLFLNDFTYTKVGLLDETHIHLFTADSIAKEFAMAELEVVDVKWTSFGLIGFQNNNPYTSISKEVKRCILTDYVSYVGQYVVRAKKCRGEIPDFYKKIRSSWRLMRKMRLSISMNIVKMFCGRWKIR